nr:FBD-associated F-box protein At4g10400-like isoform X1 [Ziziphus jujuba var. spinosa]
MKNENTVRASSSKLQSFNLGRDDEGIQMEDYISELPQEIQVKILSLLPAGRDAIVTSVLSKRWRYLWTRVCNLNFDGYRYMMNRKIKGTYKSDSEAPKFIKWVNSIIDYHNGQIDSFSVYFDLDRRSTSSIDKWVKFAMGKIGSLRSFALEFPELGGFRRSSPCYYLHRRVFDSQENVSFNSLKVLRFNCVDLNDEVFHFLLHNCSALERFEVRGSSEMVNLSVTGPSLALKHLELQNCEYIERIEICDTQNLVSFYCCCDNPDTILVIRDVPMLAEVYFHCSRYRDVVGSVFTTLSDCLWQLQILQLNISHQDYVENRVYNTLTNLKQLNLVLNGCDNYNLLKLIPFIKAFPRMQKLELKLLSWTGLRFQEWHKSMKPKECPHQNLKEVEVLGYTGRTSDVELITYFIENAKMLEKIAIKSFQFMEYRTCQPPLTKKEEEMRRNHAMKHLKGKVPSTVEFICP